MQLIDVHACRHWMYPASEHRTCASFHCLASQNFCEPIEVAAAALCVGLTSFKKLCRHGFGITRWPYRKRESLLQVGTRADG